MMAASEIFQVRIVGKGGHGANPHEAIDPILAASQIVTNMQSIVSRELSPLEPGVISVGSLHGGSAHNVIPSEVQLEGTIRTFNPQTREYILERFEEIVSGIAESHGCRSEIKLEKLSPAVSNDPEIAGKVRSVVSRLFPDARLDETYRTMTSEDMALIMEGFKSCYLLVGSANKALGLDAKHHHPRFDFDERALIQGTAVITTAAISLLDR
jgi:amidohydrolase